MVTDNGNFLIDWKFEEDQTMNWAKVNQQLMMIPGRFSQGRACPHSHVVKGRDVIV